MYVTSADIGVVIKAIATQQPCCLKNLESNLPKYRRFIRQTLQHQHVMWATPTGRACVGPCKAATASATTAVAETHSDKKVGESAGSPAT